MVRAGLGVLSLILGLVGWSEPEICQASPPPKFSLFLSSLPVQRAAAVSGELSLSRMDPQVVIVGQPTRVSLEGSAFSVGTEVSLTVGGHEVAAADVQVVSSGTLTGNVTLPETAAGPIAVTAHRPDGSQATLPGAAQAQEAYWGLQTSDGTIVSGRVGSGDPLWVEGNLAARGQPRRARSAEQAISDCERIPFCTLVQNNLVGYYPTSNDLPNECAATFRNHGETIETDNITYFICSSGPCVPSNPNLVKNVAVALKVRPRYWTGGHCHSEPGRPGGPPPDSVSGNTGTTGLGFSVLHRWPDVAGALNVIFYSIDPSYQLNTAQDTSYIYCIRGGGNFESLQEGAGYTLTGDKPQHPFDHYGAPKVIEALKQLALDVQATLPWASPLVYNDMSLSSGGLFDEKEATDPSFAWKQPHCAHRGGREVDLRTISYPDDADKLDKLDAIIRKNGFDIYKHKPPDPPHWHLTYTYPR